MPTLPPARLELDAETERRLLQLAETRQRPADMLVREAVEQYIDREERRAQLRQEVLAAWSAYQATGRHVTGDEADAWMARLDAGEDVGPPPTYN